MENFYQILKKKHGEELTSLIENQSLEFESQEFSAQIHGL